MSQRTERIDELLRQEIGDIVAREVADPRVGFVTITNVETSPDLSHARVWVSVIGQAAERDAAIGALGRAMPFVRRSLGARLRLRRIPELHVRLDDSAERGTRVLRLLHEIEEGRLPEDVPAVGESLPTPRPPGDSDEPGADAAGADEAAAARPPRRVRSQRRSGGGPGPARPRRTTGRRRPGGR